MNIYCDDYTFLLNLNVSNFQYPRKLFLSQFLRSQTKNNIDLLDKCNANTKSIAYNMMMFS